MFLGKRAFDTGAGEWGWIIKPGHEDRFYRNRVVLLHSDRGYMNNDCELTRKGISAQPFVFGNQLYTSDGKIADVCGESTEARRENGKDVGTFVHTWPPAKDMIRWTRHAMNLTTLDDTLNDTPAETNSTAPRVPNSTAPRVPVLLGVALVALLGFVVRLRLQKLQAAHVHGP
jgi:hypothetical protein